MEKNIALDFDGVINDAYHSRNSAAKKLFGIDIDFKKKRPRELIDEAKEITYEQFKEIRGYASTQEEYVEIPDALKYIQKLFELGFKIKIVTNRYSEGRVLEMNKFKFIHF